MKELRTPPAAERDEQSWEVMRVWVAEHGLHCSLLVGVYESEGIPEEKAWGVILADAARHVANAISSKGLRGTEAALAEIGRNFAAELEQPTSETHGAYLQ